MLSEGPDPQMNPHIPNQALNVIIQLFLPNQRLVDFPGESPVDLLIRRRLDVEIVDFSLDSVLYVALLLDLLFKALKGDFAGVELCLGSLEVLLEDFNLVFLLFLLILLFCRCWVFGIL